MSSPDETLQEDTAPGADEAPRREERPGLLVVFSGGAPMRVTLPVARGRTELGRAELAEHGVEDPRTSRRHVAIERRDDALLVHDLGSTNGLFLDGARLTGSSPVPRGSHAVLRLGRTVMLVAWDVGRFEGPLVPVRDGVVEGAALRGVHRRLAALAQAGTGVFLRGESGVGKEVAARTFHRAGPRAAGPFIAVNCAAVPRDLAERLFFGAVRGAYSGADQSAQGYVQAADGGTLFLDEVADLDLAVQAKLLRVLDAREVVPLGATAPQRVSVNLCAATLRDLRAEVAAGRFREDLYYRIGRPEVLLPPLRERLDEVAFFIDRVAREGGARVGASFVEACLLRAWPGNVRELCAEVRSAAALASADAAPEVLGEHLDPRAGREVRANPTAPPTPAASSDEPLAPEAEQMLRAAAAGIGLAQKTVRKLLTPQQLVSLAARVEGATPDEALVAVRGEVVSSLRERLEAAGFNQSAVAAALGTSRTTLLKLCDELGVPKRRASP